MNDKRINEVIQIKDNKLIIDEKDLNYLITDVNTVKNSIEEFDKKLRSTLLEAMTTYGISKYDLDDYIISLVVGKPEETFDEDAFLDNESDDVCNLFVNFKEEQVFNMEKLQKNFPDVYKSCLDVNEVYEIDTKTLSKLRPDIYQKYITYAASTRKTTIAIKEKKKK